MAVTPFKSSDNFNMAGFNEKITEVNNELEPVTIFEQDINYSGNIRNTEAVVCTIPKGTDFSSLLEKRNLIIEIKINKIAKIINKVPYDVKIFVNSPFTYNLNDSASYNLGVLCYLSSSQQISNLELKNVFREAYFGVNVNTSKSTFNYVKKYNDSDSNLFSICTLDSLFKLNNNANLTISCVRESDFDFVTCEVTNLQGKLKVIAQ